MFNDYDKARLWYTLRQNVRSNTYPLLYRADKRFYNGNYAFNCYAYALGLKVLNRNYSFLLKEGLCIYNPGTISGFVDINHNETGLISSVMDDCDVLGLEFKPSDIDAPILSDMSKIAIYIQPCDNVLRARDFHFARLNVNGKWSHMMGFGGCVEKLTTYEVEHMPNYNYLGVYSLRKKK